MTLTPLKGCAIGIAANQDPELMADLEEKGVAKKTSLMTFMFHLFMVIGVFQALISCLEITARISLAWYVPMEGRVRRL